MSEEAGKPEQHGLRLWSKVIAALGIAMLAALIGYFVLLPTEPLTQGLVQPTITIGASHRGVKAAVSMAATGDVTASAPPSAAGNHFVLTIQILSPITSQLIIEVKLTGLPALSHPAAVLVPLYKVGAPIRGRPAGYLASLSFSPPPSGAGHSGPAQATIPISTLKPIISVVRGPDLQITFPLVQGEPLTAAPSPSAPVISGFLGGYQAQPSGTPPVYQATLIAGSTEFTANTSAVLSDYETLAGDPPTPMPGEKWSWNGVGAVTLLAQDVITANQAQQGLFWAGIAIGVAAASAAAFAMELVAVSSTLSARRQAARKLAAEAAQAAGPAGKK